jgi:site-specific recombinase XerC
LDRYSHESYGMIIHGFCAWLVEENKLQENPAAFIKAKISTASGPYSRVESNWK